MSNSSLVDTTIWSPNHSGKRTHKIDRITIHCVVGQCTAEALGYLFQNPSRQASSNYGVAYDGRIGLYVSEANRSWCSSSPSNDQRAVTIEVASDTFAPYAVTDKAYNSTIKLVADICKRNGIKKLNWTGNLDDPKDGEAIMTAHRWFANTFCPGDYLYSRFGDIANKVNEILDAEMIEVNDWVTIKEHSKPYGMDREFSPVLWGVPHIVQQINGDRVVVYCDKYGIEACYMKDLVKCEAPSEPIVEEPIEDPIEEQKPSEPVEEEKQPSFWARLIKALLEVIREVFNKEN